MDLPPALRRLLHHDGTAIAVFGLDGSIRDVNTPMLRLVGASSVVEVNAGSPADGVLRSFLDQIPSELFRSGAHVWHGRVDHHDPSGRRLVLRATASASHDAAASGGGDLALLLHDITDSDDRMRALVHRATHDPLTGLANRHQLLRQLAGAVAAQRGRVGHVAVIFLDLDHLKYVNDAFGHGAGDRLLASSARRLEQAVRPADDVARIGGDEFLVIATDVTDSVDALELADRIRRALTGHLSVGEIDLDFSVSVGVALTDEDVMDLDDDDAASMLISNADSAMYESKQNGRGRCTVYTSQMRSTARRRTEMAGELARALTDGAVGVAYQPIHSAVSGAVVAAEALVRWSHPTMGDIDAATVVEGAEGSGAMGRLGEFVLEQALVDLGAWQATGSADSTFAVHVNVSRVQLASSSFVNLVMDRLRHHRLAPAQLVLEARDSPLLGRESEVVRSIRALRRFGVQIAVDNFGTGAKALAVLTDVGADVLKLDGSLALPSGSTDTDMRLVRAVVLLAHSLDMEVGAERVSGNDQLRRLQAAGCDMVQGNFIGRPVPAHALDFSVSPTI
ncbi:MAG: EAL domain-containing protein [Ilumatobacter sp.]|uniref:putative bifunctional diguanylate cyclase/phosphodiesterase n=1 Tax=Ilumatobacter sp. TaxID=1967498 RepID=UPI0032979D2C